MGKVPGQGVAEDPDARGNSFCFWLCNRSGICSKATLKWVTAVLVSVNLLVFALLTLDPFHRQQQQHVTGAGTPAPAPAPAPFQPQVLATFVLQLPADRLNESIASLQADLEAEIHTLNQSLQVLILSVEGGGGANSTVTFALLPDLSDQQQQQQQEEEVPGGIDKLRSALISIFLNESNINLDSPFGPASQFQILRFPGGLTMQPDSSDQQHLDSPSVVLFNFTLPKTLVDLVRSYQQLKQQISSFTHLGSREILDVKLTNEAGSTVYLPVVVQVSVASAVPGWNVPMLRLQQLAQVVADSPTSKNLGLDMTTFGDVQALNLSSALVNLRPPSPAPSPGLSRYQGPPPPPHVPKHKATPPPRHYPPPPPPNLAPPPYIPPPPSRHPPPPPTAAHHPPQLVPPPLRPRLPAPSPGIQPPLPAQDQQSSSCRAAPNPLLLCLVLLPAILLRAL